MSGKTDVEVSIGGKVYTLRGYESEEYLQRVAGYLNNKRSEIEQMEGYSRQSVDTQNMLLQLNIVDDLFKSRTRIEMLEEEVRRKEEEIYQLKHDLISSQMKLNKAERNAKNS